MAKRELNATVIQKVEIAPGLMVLRLVPDGWELPDFKPGQFTVLGLPGAAPRCRVSDPEKDPLDPDKIIPRAYSVSSSSLANEYLEFYISLVRSGELTPRLFNLEIGDRLWLSKKFTGYFTFDGVPDKANVLLVATGTGLAPYMSMTRSRLTHETRRRFAIIHGAYHSWDLGFRAELSTLSRLSPVFTYISVISSPEEEPVPWSGETGFVQEVWKKRLVDAGWGFKPQPDNTHIFLCGHPAMVEAMEEIVQAEGFKEHTSKSPGQYHVERYW